MLRHKEAPVLATHLVLVVFLTSKSSIQMGGQGFSCLQEGPRVETVA